MGKIRIISVSLENFKGFKELDVRFDPYQAIILSGKNGYGKTTIFDVIELVFTGRIKRYESYLAYHRHNTSLSQEVLPLVYDNDNPYVNVSVWLDVDGKRVSLYREEKNISNPINFEHAFTVLKVQYMKDGEYVNEEDRKSVV